MATTRHRSLVERGGRKALLETLHIQKNNVRKKPILTNLKKRFEHIELPAKLLDYFVRSDKSSINQSYYLHVIVFFEQHNNVTIGNYIISLNKFNNITHSMILSL